MARSAVAKATQAAAETADALLAWLRSQRSAAAAVPAATGRTSDQAGLPENGAAAVEAKVVDGAPETPIGTASELGDRQDPAYHAPDPPVAFPPGSDNSSPGAAPPLAGPALPTAEPCSAPPLRLPHTDWLYHRLTVSGPSGEVERFRYAAAGTGIIPWHLDLDVLEEDWFLLLMSPPRGLAAPQTALSTVGARVLARQLREAVAARHEAAIALVGRSRTEAVCRACPFDLHALVPVPDDILRLGPDDPASLAWLWEHWGTTKSLRYVEDATTQRARGEGTPIRVPRMKVGVAVVTMKQLAIEQSYSPSGRPTGRHGVRCRKSRLIGRLSPLTSARVTSARERACRLGASRRRPATGGLGGSAAGGVRQCGAGGAGRGVRGPPRLARRTGADAED